MAIEELHTPAGAMAPPAAVGGHFDVLDRLGVAAVVIDVGGRVRWWSDAAAALSGYAAEEMVGNVIEPVHLAPATRPATGEIVQRLLEDRVWSGELALLRRSGEEVRVDVTASVLCDAGGRPEAVLAGFTGATDARAADEFSRVALDSLPAHVAVLDETGRIVAVNRAWREFSAQEGTGEDWIGTNYLAVCERGEAEGALEVAVALRAMLAGRRWSFEYEYPCHGPRERRWFRLRATRHDSRGSVCLVLAHEPVTPLRLAEEQVSLQAALLDEIDVAVMVADATETVVDWNTGAEKLYGYSRHEAIGAHLGDLILPPGERLVAIRQVHAGGGPVRVRRRLRRKDGTLFTAHTRVCAIERPDGGPLYVSVSIDESEREAAEQALTSARNYLSAVTDNMGDAMYTLDAGGHVMYMNRVAQELLGWSMSELGGRSAHEVIHDHPAGAGAEDCPILRAGRECHVVRVDDDAFVRRDGELLPVRYTAAPFQTEEGTQGCVVVFQDITARKAEAERVRRDLEKLTWVTRIQEALRDDGFRLYAQPIIDLRSGEVAQRELLLRMRSARHGDDAEVVSPGHFLPVAEEYGLITEIDRWVVEKAAEIASDGTAVELNVSARSVSDPSFTEHVRAALDRTGARAEALVFEITETALITDEVAARHFVERLHMLGCGIALDDFGTGYGGFTYLKHLPIDALKIDIEFVRDLVDNAASRNVVEAVVGLARGFGLKTVAEGVEDAPTLDLLRELGVDFAQGFHIGRPAPL